MDWLNAVAQGVLIGGLYALFAAGLSLIFGVMRLVNIAHGDLILLAAYVTLAIVAATGLNPLVAIVIASPVMALFGYVLQRVVFNRTLGDDLLPPLLVSFGLSVIIQNSLLMTFSADSRKLDAGLIETASWNVAPGLSLGLLPLLMFGAAIVVIGSLQFMFYRTPLGRALRATSDDPEIARLERQLEHPAGEGEDVPGHHVVEVDVSHAATRPTADACDPRVEPRQGERQE